VWTWLFKGGANLAPHWSSWTELVARHFTGWVPRLGFLWDANGMKIMWRQHWILPNLLKWPIYIQNSAPCGQHSNLGKTIITTLTPKHHQHHLKIIEWFHTREANSWITLENPRNRGRFSSKQEKCRRRKATQLVLHILGPTHAGTSNRRF
jgi:hypothetical protein